MFFIFAYLPFIGFVVFYFIYSICIYINVNIVTVIVISIENNAQTIKNTHLILLLLGALSTYISTIFVVGYICCGCFCFYIHVYLFCSMCLYVCVIGLRFYLFLWNGCCFMTEDLFALLFEGRKVKVVVCGCWVSLNHNEVFDLKFTKFYIQKSIVSLKVQWFRVRFVWWLSLLNFFVSVCECVCVCGHPLFTIFTDINI